MSDCGKKYDFRQANQKDAAGLLKIYDQYINTSITFEYTLPSEEEFAERIFDVQKTYPYLVCEDQGRLVGYAYAHRLQARAAYQWNAELSVYVDEEYVSKGIGHALYAKLIEILKMQGVKTVYGIVSSPNERSEKLHLRMGFKKVSILHHTGFKNGEWRDVNWFEKPIAEYELEPEEIISIHDIPEEIINHILTVETD